MKNIIIGLCIMLVGNIAGFIVNHHYGYNWWPQSHGEIICDFIVLSISAFGFGILFTQAFLTNTNHENTGALDMDSQ